MAEPVDLLLLTHNRRRYLEKMLPQLLEDPADFRLHCWDNASTDGAADIIASVKDERVVRKHFSEENLNQTEPSLWFLESATSDVVGKVDDDILLPHGWINRIKPMVRSQPELGMIGCWVYMPQDWDPHLAAHNVVTVGPYQVLQVVAVPGQSFLARRQLLLEHLKPERPGFPVDGPGMSINGYINGHPARPLLMAHNMDDPRSPYCLIDTAHANSNQQPFTMRRHEFDSEAYARWIAADAHRRLAEPVDEQIGNSRLRREQGPSFTDRLRHRLTHLLGQG